jgi:hypothetical protein
MRDVLLGEVWNVPTAQERIQNKLLSMQFQDEMDRRNELIKQANMLTGPPVMEQPMATPPEGQMTMPVQSQMPINTPSTMPIAQNAPQSTFPPQPMQNPMQNRNALAPQPQIQNYGQLQAHRETQAMLGDQLKIVKALAESNPGAVEAYWNSNPMLKKLGSYNSEMAENGTVQHYISGPDGKPQMVGASFKVPGGKWQFVNLKDIDKPAGQYKTEVDILRGAAEGDPLAIRMLGLKKEGKVSSQKAPAGYRFDSNNELEPIPGGPADFKRHADQSKAYSKATEITAGLDSLAAAAMKLKNHPGLPRITGIMGSVPNIPGTDAANAQADFDALKAQVGLNTLATLKAGTGAGLGQVTEAEHKLLQNFLAALSNKQSTAALKKSLDTIIKFTEDSKGRINSGYERLFEKRPATSQGQKQPIPAERNQNPLNIKRGGATEYLIKEGIATPGSEAKDGGNFLKFNSAEEGLEAGKKLLFDSSVYRNLTVDAAMKKWSNGGYGGNIAPQLAMKTVGSLNQQERDTLVKAMIRAEGSGSTGPKSTTKGKIDRATARKYFEKYNYDKTKALAAAKRDGYEVD